MLYSWGERFLFALRFGHKPQVHKKHNIILCSVLLNDEIKVVDISSSMLVLNMYVIYVCGQLVVSRKREINET